MDHTLLAARHSRGHCTIQTNMGLAFDHCRSSIVSNRGLSQPAERPRLWRGLVHELHVKRRSARALEIWQTLENRATEPLAVRRITMLDGFLQLDGAGWNLGHAELFKVERYFGGYSLYTDGLLAALPGVEGEFGLSEDTPFPGLLVHHPERGTLLMAVLTQDRCKPCWNIRSTKRRLHLTATDYFSGIDAMPVAAGATFASEHWLLLAGQSGLDGILDEYFDFLRGQFRFRGQDSVLREEAVWGSWNYNRRPRGHGDIDHRYLAANAHALRKLHRKIRWMMIDDGYQRGYHERRPGATEFWSPNRGVDMFWPRLATAHDPRRFPEGMAAMAQAIRRAGLKPAIWCTPLIHAASPLAQDHPEWLLQLEGGRQFIKGHTFLDYSLPEVREHFRHSWNVIFNDWRFAGFKLDFWTYPFELPQVRYRRRDQTAIELRNLFLAEVRSFVPAGGYLLTCCTINAGNPFLGRFADASRAGLDIGDGGWPAVLSAATWLSVASLFYRGDCLLADADSIGWSSTLSEAENRAWATVALLAGGMCEVGGDMTRLAAPARRLLLTALRCFGPSQRCGTTVGRPGSGGLPSADWVQERTGGCYSAWINWREYPRQIRWPRTARDCWSGQHLALGRQVIPRHGALLVEN